MNDRILLQTIRFKAKANKDGVDFKKDEIVHGLFNIFEEYIRENNDVRINIINERISDIGSSTKDNVKMEDIIPETKIIIEIHDNVNKIEQRNSLIFKKII